MPENPSGTGTIPSSRAGPKEWTGLGVLALPTILLGLDVTLLYLALPALSADLRPTGTQALWILDSYGLVIAGLLVTMGAIGDRLGRRRLLMIGTAAFALVSIAAAFAPSAEILIAARALLGVAGATLMPSCLALITNMFTDARQRALAIGVWATTFALGMAAGPLVGGVLLESFWWGSAFLLALPIAALVLLTAPVLLPEYRAAHSGRVDLLSVALSLGAILPLVYAIKHAATHGFDTQSTATLAASAVFTLVFVRRQRRLSDPLLDVALFTNRSSGTALGVLLVGLVGVGGALYLVTQHLQLVEELSPLAAGAWMGPPALAMVVAAIGAPLLARRVRPGYVVAGTLVLSVLGYVLLTQVRGPDSIGLIVSGFALVYLGFGSVGALGSDLVVSTTPAHRAGSAAAMSETVQELGVAMGVAMLGSLTTLVYRDQMRVTDVPGGNTPAVSESLAGAMSTPQVSPQLLAQAKEAFIAGLNISAVITGVAILALAVMAAVVLRHIPPSDSSEPS
ncbi:MFS transporter [Amycolatopsis sp. NPDC052450]|uniref:MFS transporter n=1 Tax=Amycolatopsis sp. NPDC052450 TaxID=3363937 RepID=UPI0037CAA1F3